MTAQDRERQIAEAEEILGQRLSAVGFAKGLFFGQFLADRLPPYPDLAADTEAQRLAAELRTFCAQRVDPVAIDRQAKIPDEVVQGLGRLGVLGACLPASAGGLGLTQTAYCQLMEILGGHCASTALFVNAHHSIGPRAIVLFGTDQQQQQWLPRLATGEWLSAFALTEPQAGSDAANVQTVATPTADGRGFQLSGEKQWITNGGLAHVLTVMARTPVPESPGKTAITAFIVTPDMPGFHVIESRMEKCGVRGTATSRLRFENMVVPRENVLGQIGKGLRVALTVLDYGRTTFGASCTGAAKFCLRRAIEHVRERVQFDQPLAEFELVQTKIAEMQADVYAMEACTYQTAALVDANESEFMIETALLKVFATERLWRIIYDTFQLHGGRAYFTDEPFERMMRDARINQIGEGANDVLRVFSALVGMRDVGLELEGILDALRRPVGNVGRLGSFVGRMMGSYLVGPEIVTHSSELEPACTRLASDVRSVGHHVIRLLRVHQRQIVERQCLVARMADAVMELYTSTCVLRRLDHLLSDHGAHGPAERLELATGQYYLQASHRRLRAALAALGDHHDDATLSLARQILWPKARP